MFDTIESFYNEYFNQQDNIKVINDFSKINNKFLAGKFEYSTLKGKLDFYCLIPITFPIGKMEFKCLTTKGFEHQNPNQYLCLNTPPSNDLQTKLSYEFDKLSKWINKFFINDEKDERYEHPLFHKISEKNETMIFSENGKNNFSERFTSDFGEFIYSELFSVNVNLFIVKKIGNLVYDWSYIYRTSKNDFKGMWIKTSQIPIIQRRERISNWKDLLEILPSDFSEKFCTNIKSNTTNINKYSKYFIMIGYEIPADGYKEINWDLIILSDFRNILKEIKKNNFNFSNYNSELVWGKTQNASYSRLFGRGSFSKKFTNSKILIIGLGAIGSNLAVSLTRGGAKNIMLIDYDIIEPGNISRSVYDFNSTNQLKTISLKFELIKISPYVEVETKEIDFTISKNSKEYSDVKKFLSDFEFIFDCTASMDVSYSLDEFNLDSKVFNFSITDEAKEFICVSGVSKISKKKELIFNNLGAVISNDSFYEGTGCWFPTFKANNAELNLLLNFALNEINNRLENDISTYSFILKRSIIKNNVNVEIINEP